MSLLDMKAGVVEVPLSDKELRVLDDICQKQDMSRVAVLRQSLRVYQLVKETPGAIEAIDRLRPNLGPVGCMGDE